MNVPYVVPEDEVTPYPADFDRVVDAVREMGYALDVIEKGRAAGELTELLRRARNPAPLSAQLQNLRVRRIPEKSGVRRQIRQLVLVVVTETHVPGTQ